MGMNLGKILSSPQTFNWLGQFGASMAPEGSGAQRLGQSAQGITAAQIQQEARKKQKEEEEKAKKKSLLTTIGGTIGGLAAGSKPIEALGGNVAMASKFLLPAAGSAGGQALAGGGISPTNTLVSGLGYGTKGILADRMRGSKSKQGLSEEEQNLLYTGL